MYYSRKRSQYTTLTLTIKHTATAPCATCSPGRTDALSCLGSVASSEHTRCFTGGGCVHIPSFRTSTKKMSCCKSGGLTFLPPSYLLTYPNFLFLSLSTIFFSLSPRTRQEMPRRCASAKPKHEKLTAVTHTSQPRSPADDLPVPIGEPPLVPRWRKCVVRSSPPPPTTDHRYYRFQ